MDASFESTGEGARRRRFADAAGVDIAVSYLKSYEVRAVLRCAALCGVIRYGIALCWDKLQLANPHVHVCTV